MSRKTYVFQTNPDGTYCEPMFMVEKHEQLYPYHGGGSSSKASHNIIGDIEPYRSTIDGSVIGSRSRHRAHLKEHNCVEIGCDTPKDAQKYFEPPKLSKKERVDDVRRIYEKLESSG